MKQRIAQTEGTQNPTHRLRVEVKFRLDERTAYAEVKPIHIRESSNDAQQCNYSPTNARGRANIGGTCLFLEDSRCHPHLEHHLLAVDDGYLTHSPWVKIKTTKICSVSVDLASLSNCHFGLVAQHVYKSEVTPY
jgi:hypothetical protein